MAIPHPGEAPTNAVPSPSAEPLPDFSDVDAAALLRHTGHPVLAGVVADLLSRWPREEDAVAYYDDGAK